MWNGTEEKFILSIKDINDKGDRFSITFTGDEELVGTYYLNDIEEKEYLSDILKIGTEVLVKGTLTKPLNNTIPNNFNYKSYLNNKDIYYQLKIESIEVIKDSSNVIDIIKNWIIKRIDKIDNTGYMRAFVLGDNSLIDDKIYEIYQEIGVTHLFALSGSQVVLLSLVILRFLKIFKTRIKYIIAISFIIVYGFIVGYPASIKRAIVFFIIASINKLEVINLSNIKILFLTVVVLILSNYKIIYDIAFLYSVLTVFGIFLAREFIDDKNKFKSSFKLSIVAFLFSLPITLYNFYELNVLSIIYNLIYIPYVSFILYPFCILTFLFPIGEDILLFLINIMEEVSLFLNEISFLRFNLNFNLSEVLIFYLILCIIFKYNKYKMSWILYFIIILDVIVPYIDSNLRVYYLDVGQGDSTLIITPYKKEVILIDTGGKITYEKELKGSKSYVSDGTLMLLKSLGIKKIDYLILTHGDYDHMGEAVYLIDNIEVKQVIFNQGGFNNLEKQLIEELEKEDILYKNDVKSIKLNRSELFFLEHSLYDNENDNSNILYLKSYKYDFLFMGDAGVEVEKEIFEKYDLKEIDVLKVGHHGSNSSSDKEFIDVINPIYSLISVGRNNRYGHPHKEVIDNLENSIIFRTDIDGSVVFTFNDRRFNIQLYKP